MHRRAQEGPSPTFSCSSEVFSVLLSLSPPALATSSVSSSLVSLPESSRPENTLSSLSERLESGSLRRDCKESVFNNCHLETGNSCASGHMLPSTPKPSTQPGPSSPASVHRTCPESRHTNPQCLATEGPFNNIDFVEFSFHSPHHQHQFSSTDKLYTLLWHPRVLELERHQLGMGLWAWEDWNSLNAWTSYSRRSFFTLKTGTNH